MNEYTLFWALFFVAMILLGAGIIVVIAFGRALSKKKRKKKAKRSRKRFPVVSSKSDREEDSPASTITIDNCWFHRV